MLSMSPCLLFACGGPLARPMDDSTTEVTETGGDGDGDGDGDTSPEATPEVTGCAC